MTHNNLAIRRDGHVATVTLDRPERYNALSVEMMRELEAAALSFREDTETRVVLFTGAGRNFCAGIDLKDPQHASAGEKGLLAARRAFQLGPRLIRALREMEQITIAALNGAAVGAGACIASALDFRVGAEDCLVGYPESDLAIPLSWLSLPLCVHLVGPARAKRWLITGERWGAAQLERYGFLDMVVPAEDLADQAQRLAGEYAARPPAASQMIKRSVNEVVDAIDRAVMHMDTDQVLLARGSADFQEGARAFIEKRPPRFTGG